MAGEGRGARARGEGGGGVAPARARRRGGARGGRGGCERGMAPQGVPTVPAAFRHSGRTSSHRESTARAFIHSSPHHLEQSPPPPSPRDEPGSGGVRVGQTRSDLDCRVVATSRRVAPTECDSRLPLFGRGLTCRLRLLDSWAPPGSGVVFDSSRGSTRVSRPVAPTE